MSAEPLFPPSAVPATAGTAESIDAGWWAGRLGRIHRRHGLAGLIVGPSGYAACASDDLPGVTFFGLAGTGGVRWTSRRRLTVADVDHPAARSLGLAVVRVVERPPAERARLSPATAGTATATSRGRPDPSAWAADLCAEHVELTRLLIDAAVDHLGSRTLDGTPLLSRQVPQALLADTAMDIAEAVECFRAAANVAHLADIHRRVVAAARRVVRLLGARGFVLDGPGGALYAAELTCRLYLDLEADR